VTIWRLSLRRRTSTRSRSLRSGTTRCSGSRS
jgi:hypothetical protein